MTQKSVMLATSHRKSFPCRMNRYNFDEPSDYQRAETAGDPSTFVPTPISADPPPLSNGRLLLRSYLSSVGPADRPPLQRKRLHKHNSNHQQRHTNRDLPIRTRFVKGPFQFGTTSHSNGDKELQHEANGSVPNLTHPGKSPQQSTAMIQGFPRSCTGAPKTAHHPWAEHSSVS